MPLDLSAVGQSSEPYDRPWSSKDTLLYALGVGAGQDPLRELEFTTENSSGVEQRVLPTFAVLLAQSARRPRASLGTFDFAMLVHAEQSFSLRRPLPPAGTVRLTSTVTGIYDKGSGALVVTETEGADPETGDLVLTSRSSAFIRGEGGFGGPRGPASDWAAPAGKPEHEVTYGTGADQALLYRLSGDRNPLHSDPVLAARAGFPRPILHGLCTYGFAGRALLHALCDSDPGRFGSMSGRFTRPVFPGDELTTAIWPGGRFQVRTGDGSVVIDHGRFTPTERSS